MSQLGAEQGGQVVLLGSGGGGANRGLSGLGIHGGLQPLGPVHGFFLGVLLFCQVVPSLHFSLCDKYNYSLWCWRAISARMTEAAVETLKELTWPYMGMETMPSQVSFTTRDTPSPSLPMTRAQGPLKLVS